MSPIRKEVTIGDCRLQAHRRCRRAARPVHRGGQSAGAEAGVAAVTRPDFSPAMLSLFLRARAHFAHESRAAAAAQTGKPPARNGFQATARDEKALWRKLAGVTHAEMEFAWTGRLLSPAPRARLWGALGHVPGDYGVLLTHGGQERADG